MIRNTLKQIYSQGKSNVWIVLEIFAVFIIIWVIIDYFSVLYITSSTSKGFDYHDTYRLTLVTRQPGSSAYVEDETGEQRYENFMRIVNRLQEHPEIEVVSLGQFDAPYTYANMNNGYFRDSLRTSLFNYFVTPSYFQVYNINPKEGGGPEQLMQAIENGYIISGDAESALFPGCSAKNKHIHTRDSTFFLISDITTRIKRDEYSRPLAILYRKIDETYLRNSGDDDGLHRINISFRTKTKYSGRIFADTFKKDMKQQFSVGNYYLADVIPTTEQRKSYLKETYEAIKYRTGFTLFFLVNVFLGIIGTFWLRIKKRKAEVGLRMALGAERKGIKMQMLQESFLLLLIAFVPALLVCLNIAYLEIPDTTRMDITFGRLFINTIVSFCLLAVSIGLATWYPAKRSSQIEPAEALHYE